MRHGVKGPQRSKTLPAASPALFLLFFFSYQSLKMFFARVYLSIRQAWKSLLFHFFFRCVYGLLSVSLEVLLYLVLCFGAVLALADVSFGCIVFLQTRRWPAVPL